MRSAGRRTKRVSRRFARGTWRETLRKVPRGFGRDQPWVLRRETGATISIGLEGCMFSGTGRDNLAAVPGALAGHRGRQRTGGMTNGEAPHVAPRGRPCLGTRGIGPFRGVRRRDGHHRGNGRRRPPRPHRRTRGVRVEEWRGAPPPRAPRGRWQRVRWQRVRSLAPALGRVRILSPRRPVVSVPFAPTSDGRCSGPCSTFF